MQATCKDCPASYFCDGSIQNDTHCSHGVQNPESCPTGYYCLLNTKLATEYACPNGTYNPSLNLYLMDQCTPCPGGMYCYGNTGLSYPTGQCHGGYYCLQGASTPTPTDNVTGNVCPVGAYCPGGSNFTTLCPPGTYNPTIGKMLCTLL